MADNKKISPQGYLYFSVPFSTNPFWEGEGPAPSEPVVEPLNITANGTYEAPEGVDGYNPITVDVADSGSKPVIKELQVESMVGVNYKTSEGSRIYDAKGENADGFDPVIVEPKEGPYIGNNAGLFVIVSDSNNLNPLLNGNQVEIPVVNPADYLSIYDDSSIDEEVLYNNTIKTILLGSGAYHFSADDLKINISLPTSTWRKVYDILYNQGKNYIFELNEYSGYKISYLYFVPAREYSEISDITLAEAYSINIRGDK